MQSVTLHVGRHFFHFNLICTMDIIAGTDREKLSFFIKKLFFKVGKLLSNVRTKPNDSCIPEKETVQFYGLVHQFSTNDEYKMYCLIKFEGTSENVSVI